MTMLHTDPARSIAWPESDAALLFVGGMARQDLAAHRSFFGDAALAPSEQIAELVDASALPAGFRAGVAAGRYQPRKSVTALFSARMSATTVLAPTAVSSPAARATWAVRSMGRSGRRSREPCRVRGIRQFR